MALPTEPPGSPSPATGEATAAPDAELSWQEVSVSDLDRLSVHSVDRQESPSTLSETSQDPTPAVPEDDVPNDTASKDALPEETTPNDTLSKDAVFEDALPQDPVPKDAIPQDDILESYIGREILSRYSSPYDIITNGGRQDENSTEEADKRQYPMIEYVMNGAHHKPDDYCELTFRACNWPMFKSLAKFHGRRPVIIEVLVGKPMDDHINQYELVDLDQSIPALPNYKPSHELPERIRIHSKELLSIIAKFSGAGPNALPVEGDGSAVFVRPFKALTYCEPSLRRWHSALKRIHESMKHRPRTDNNVNANDLYTRFPLITEAIETVHDLGGIYDLDLSITEDTMHKLKSLLVFIDRYIKRHLSRLTIEHCKKAFFSDLWHLFRPGTEVISADGHQVYRVLKVTSRHRPTLPQPVCYTGPKPERYPQEDDENSGREPDLSVECMYIDYDGRQFGLATTVFHFWQFEGERMINSLKLYPLRHHVVVEKDLSQDEMNELRVFPQRVWPRQRMLRRARNFIDVVGTKHMYYSGPNLDTRGHIEGEVIIDFDAAFAAGQGHIQRPNLVGLSSMRRTEPPPHVTVDCKTCCRDETRFPDEHIDQKVSNDYVEQQFRRRDVVEHFPSLHKPVTLEGLSYPNAAGFSNKELRTVFGRVPGFVLENRTWVNLDPSFLTDVRTPHIEVDNMQVVHRQLKVNQLARMRTFRALRLADESMGNPGARPRKSFPPLDQLQLAHGHMELIMWLMEQHHDNRKLKSTHHEDHATSKGKALTMLFHGSTGTGKTATAVGIAKYFEKPLFPIVLGELGTTVEEVDDALKKNMALAKKWDCIVVLDETHIFVHETADERLKRNQLLTVFYRALQSYTGIVFITTNRINDFDKAFLSRLSLTLRFADLDMEATAACVMHNMDRLAERCARRGKPLAVNKENILSYVRHHWTKYPVSRWNGHQIRTICEAAVAAAVARSHPSVTTEINGVHLDIVRMAQVDFEEYITTSGGRSALKFGPRIRNPMEEQFATQDNRGHPESRNTEHTENPKHSDCSQPPTSSQPAMPPPPAMPTQPAMPPRPVMPPLPVMPPRPVISPQPDPTEDEKQQSTDGKEAKSEQTPAVGQVTPIPNLDVLIRDENFRRRVQYNAAQMVQYCTLRVDEAVSEQHRAIRAYQAAYPLPTAVHVKGPVQGQHQGQTQTPTRAGAQTQPRPLSPSPSQSESQPQADVQSQHDGAQPQPQPRPPLIGVESLGREPARVVWCMPRRQADADGEPYAFYDHLPMFDAHLQKRE